MNPAEPLSKSIPRDLLVAPTFDPASELERRVAFLKDYLLRSGAAGYVLGISGGVDSSVSGRLAQLAVERARAEGVQARFVAVRLPYGVQRDEHDAQQALAFIRPDETLTVNIRPAVDACMAETRAAGLDFASPAAEDFVRGNVKARQRMVVQYAIAGARGALVIGTDHGAEAVMGFFTKFGDGACDVAPLVGLNKRRVRALGALLGAPEHLVQKVPTADLEDLQPLKPDEVAHGVRYEEIDDYLEGKPVPAQARQIIEATYLRTAHKRALPVHPPLDAG